jgi:two-component system chemotaxis response regulator CheY
VIELAATAAPEPKSMKALVIDDSRAMRCIVGNILKGLGFEVVDAGHGREGLERLQGASGAGVDIVLVDWNMPEMNGIEFVTAVRERREYDGIRIVMVTTETDAGRMTEALGRGADEYVMKPFTRDILLQKLELLGLAVA